MRILQYELALYSLIHNRVPVYSLASLISLFSLDAAYWIDVGRDLYEVGRYLSIHHSLMLLGFRHLLFFQPFGKHLISILNTCNVDIGRVSVREEYYICPY